MEIFREQEAEYSNWLRHNPQGYVLNIERDAHYGSLHAASCGSITPDGERTYTLKRDKVCSLNRRELEEYARERRLKQRRVHTCL